MTYDPVRDAVPTLGAGASVITPAQLRAAYAAEGTIRLATAGTSGRPRWVVRTAASWVDSFPVVAGLCGLSAESSVWVPGPAEASMNTYAICLADHTGAPLVDDLGSASHAFCTPAVLHRLLDEQAGDDHRVVFVVAGDRLPKGLAEAAEAVGHQVHHYYGAAQLSFVAWGRDAESLTLFPEVRAATIDGELWVTSPWLCLREDSAEPVLRTMERDGELWMSVGDRGSIQPDGRITVSGRADAITTAGVTVVLADVEAALRPYARGEVLVVGRPHPRLGTVLVGVCTDPTDAQSLPVVARRELAPSHRPRAWSVLDRFPTTAAGKLDRARIAQS